MRGDDEPNAAAVRIDEIREPCSVLLGDEGRRARANANPEPVRLTPRLRPSHENRINAPHASIASPESHAYGGDVIRPVSADGPQTGRQRR